MSGPETLHDLHSMREDDLGALGSAATGSEGKAVQRPKKGLSKIVHWMRWQAWKIGERLYDDMSMLKEA